MNGQSKVEVTVYDSVTKSSEVPQLPPCSLEPLALEQSQPPCHEDTQRLREARERRSGGLQPATTRDGPLSSGSTGLSQTHDDAAPADPWLHPGGTPSQDHLAQPLEVSDSQTTGRSVSTVWSHCFVPQRWKLVPLGTARVKRCRWLVLTGCSLSITY